MTRSRRSSRPSRCLDRDPVGVPTAAFIQTDLVLVFDYLTHTLSAIASLHTGAQTSRAATGSPRPPSSRRSTAPPVRAPPSGRRSTRGTDASGGASRRPTPPALGRPIETSLGRDEYIHAVEVAKDAIAAGRGDPGRLARRQSFALPTDPATGAPLDGIGLYRALRRVNPSPYLFFTGLRPSRSSGPRRSSCSSSRRPADDPPDRGDRPRGADAREDALLAEELQRDPKERAEHVMLVDLGRNDLGRVARPGTVTVSKYMEVERYSHVLHLVSHVEGRLKPELDALDALRSVFPAGTLSGAPKVRAMH